MNKAKAILDAMTPYYARKMRARVREDNQDAQEDQALLDELDAEEADNDVAERIEALGPVDDKGVVDAKVEEEVGAGRRRRGRTKHRTKRRTIRPAHIKQLIARITRLMH